MVIPLWPTGQAWAPTAIFHMGAGCSADKHLGTAGRGRELKIAQLAKERPFPNPLDPVIPRAQALGTHTGRPPAFALLQGKNKCGRQGALFHHVRTAPSSEVMETACPRAGPRLDPLSHPYIPSGLCLATPSLTNSQSSPPLPDLKFLMFL